MLQSNRPREASNKALKGTCGSPSEGEIEESSWLDWGQVGMGTGEIRSWREMTGIGRHLGGDAMDTPGIYKNDPSDDF